jgi:geranylgeranyl diphosphate synthase type II
VKLSLHFGDGSKACLRREHSRLLVEKVRVTDPSVEVFFDDRSLKLLFDAQHRPVDSVLERSLDMRGTREELLATWRCFSLLAQRAAGLRAVQALWCEYRDLSPSAQWSKPATPQPKRKRNGQALRPECRWPALTYLNSRYPADIESRAPNSEPVLSPARSIWDGIAANSWRDHPNILDNDLNETMQRLKALVVNEIIRLVPRRQPGTAWSF